MRFQQRLKDCLSCVGFGMGVKNSRSTSRLGEVLHRSIPSMDPLVLRHTASGLQGLEDHMLHPSYVMPLAVAAAVRLARWGVRMGDDSTTIGFLVVVSDFAVWLLRSH